MSLRVGEFRKKWAESKNEPNSTSLDCGTERHESTPAKAVPDPKKRRQRARSPKRCESCGRAETPEWRRGPAGRRTLCNSCGLHYAKLTRKEKNANQNAAVGNSTLRPRDYSATLAVETRANGGNPSNATGTGTVENLSSASDDIVIHKEGSHSLSCRDKDVYRDRLTGAQQLLSLPPGASLSHQDPSGRPPSYSRPAPSQYLRYLTRTVWTDELEYGFAGSNSKKLRDHNEVKKKADPENPAVHVARSGRDVVKRASEPQVEEKGENHSDEKKDDGEKKDSEDDKKDSEEKSEDQSEEKSDDSSQGLGSGEDVSSEYAESLPLSSRTSTAIFHEAQAGLERLLMDLQSFDDGDPEDDLPDASGSDSEAYYSTSITSSGDSEPGDVCDGDRSEPGSGKSSAGSQEASGIALQGTGADGQGQNGAGHKRQRVDDGSDDCSRTTTKTKRKRVASDKEQRLICCFKDDSLTPCSGTDKSICEVIEKLATSHNRFVCKTCYVSLAESDSGEKVHPAGVECIEQCLSPRCLEGKPRSVDQKHRFDTKTCGTKTGRPRPEDRESIFRYIFRLVHAREAPADVFTIGKAPHWDMIPRQGNRKPTRDELESRVRRLSEELEELSKRDSASTKQIDVLTRNLETERTNNSNLAERMQRLQDIIADAIRPGTLNDEHWHRSILQRVRRDAPDALGSAQPQPQTLPTPPASMRGSQKPSTAPTPNVAVLTEQCQSLQEGGRRLFFGVSNMAHGNQAAGFSLPKVYLGEQVQYDIQNGWCAYPQNRGIMRDTATIPPSAPILSDGAGMCVPQDLSGLDGQWRQDTQGGQWDFPGSLMNADGIQSGGKAIPSSEFIADAAWANNILE